MSNSEIVSSAGALGMYPDPVNDRFRGTAPLFIPDVESVLNEWRAFTAEANKAATLAGRLTLRLVTSPEAAAEASRHINAEAYIPLEASVGLLYLANNAANRQPNVPIITMNQKVDDVDREIASRFREPAERLAALQQNKYMFVNYIPSQAELTALWGDTFGWTAEGVEKLEQRLAQNAQAKPADRELWFTGVMHAGHLVAAAMAERLDVPGDSDSIPTIESTEWAVTSDHRHGAGVATGMLALNVAQCLNDLPTARLLAECNYGVTAYATGFSAGFSVPERQFSPQILARNVWIDGKQPDLVTMSLSPEAVQTHYSPAARAAMLEYLNNK